MENTYLTPDETSKSLAELIANKADKEDINRLKMSKVNRDECDILKDNF